MQRDAVQQGAALIRQIDAFEMLPVVVQLLAEGRAIPIERLADQLGQSENAIRARLAKNPSIEWDDWGNIIGFGMTLRPTAHRFEFDGRTVYGWCATDAILFPILLHRPGVVRSTCPTTGRAIQIAITPQDLVRVDPPAAVVSLVRPGGKVTDTRCECCQRGHFFSSPEAAAGWLRENPDGWLHTVAEEFQVDLQIVSALRWGAGREQ